jgi:peroxiredoxin
MKYLALFSLIAVCAVSAFSQNVLRVGSPAPDFTATDLNGDSVALSQLRGNVVVMTFWSTRCPICHEEFPKLNQVVRSFSGKKVVFLSLTNDSDAKVESYLKSNPLESRVLPNSFGILMQYADRDKDGYVNIGYPAFFVINESGTIQYRGSGYDKTGPLNSTLNSLLAAM